MFIVPGYDETSAADFFMQNCKFSLLTYTSIGCITIKAVLNTGVESPYITFRINKWKQPLKIILIKIMLFEDTDEPQPKTIKLPDVRIYPFEISNNTSFAIEVNNQIKIYKETFLDTVALLDPLCPALLHYRKNINKKDMDELIKTITENFEGGDDLIDPNKNIIVELSDDDDDIKKITLLINFLNAKKKKYINKSFIIMEFLDDFKPLSNYINDKKERNKLFSHSLFEILRMHKLGIVHNDLHTDNIFINLTEEYFSSNPQMEMSGRAMIIDFGRVTISEELKEKYNNNTIEQNIEHAIQIENIKPLITYYISDENGLFRNIKYYMESRIYMSVISLNFINEHLGGDENILNIFSQIAYHGGEPNYTMHAKTMHAKTMHKDIKLQKKSTDSKSTDSNIMKFLEKHNKIMIDDIKSGQFLIDIKEILLQKGIQIKTQPRRQSRRHIKTKRQSRRHIKMKRQSTRTRHTI